MSHLSPLNTEQASPQARALFDAVQAKAKMVPNIFRIMGHAPRVLEHTLGMDEAIKHDLDPKLRELAYLTASRINHCGYCEHYHKMFARQAGLNDTQIQKVGLALDETVYSELERLVIRFADEWTRQGKASAEVVTSLEKKLSPTQLVVLAATVGLANWTNRFNETFGVQLP
jgi:uncharacterized peroxidase-related enzyme